MFNFVRYIIYVLYIIKLKIVICFSGLSKNEKIIINILLSDIIKLKYKDIQKIQIGYIYYNDCRFYSKKLNAEIKTQRREELYINNKILFNSIINKIFYKIIINKYKYFDYIDTKKMHKQKKLEYRIECVNNVNELLKQYITKKAE